MFHEHEKHRALKIAFLMTWPNLWDYFMTIFRREAIQFYIVSMNCASWLQNKTKKKHMTCWDGHYRICHQSQGGLGLGTRVRGTSNPLCDLCPCRHHRSQRDVAGEKALREQQLQELQRKLSMVEGEIVTAENDRKQFDGAVKSGRDMEGELR